MDGILAVGVLITRSVSPGGCGVEHNVSPAVKGGMGAVCNIIS